VARPNPIEVQVRIGDIIRDTAYPGTVFDDPDVQDGLEQQANLVRNASGLPDGWVVGNLAEAPPVRTQNGRRNRSWTFTANGFVNAGVTGPDGEDARVYAGMKYQSVIEEFERREWQALGFEDDPAVDVSHEDFYAPDGLGRLQLDSGLTYTIPLVIQVLVEGPCPPEEA
jgi:hypothetical protein